MGKEDHLCDEVRAAKAEKIDMTNLKSTLLTTTVKSKSGVAEDVGSKFDGFQPLMIFHVKGKKNKHVRLVEPKLSSFNVNDAYLVISQKTCVQWNGKNILLMKKSKTTEIGTLIMKQREMGCNYGSLNTYNYDGTRLDRTFLKFFKDDPNISNPESAIVDTNVSDEEFETTMNKLTAVYEVVVSLGSDEDLNGELQRVENLCGTFPSFKDISSQKCYIFDFVTEVYTWTGRSCNADVKELALSLGLNVFESPIDVSVCTDVELENIGKVTKSYQFLSKHQNYKVERPKWAMFARLGERNEYEVFKKKFIFFPSFSHETLKASVGKSISMPTQKQKLASNATAQKAIKESVPIDIEAVFKSESISPWIIDNMVINRGTGGIHPENNFTFKVVTTSTIVSQLCGENFIERKNEEKFHFYSSECYLVEWNFRYGRTGIKSLSSVFLQNDEKSLNTQDDIDDSQSGRDCSLYFYWQGSKCSVSQKGTSAYATVTSVGSKAHQILVEQHRETPAFCALFSGNLIQHDGSQKEHDKTKPHCYWIKGVVKEEIILVEVPMILQELRTNAAYIVICNKGNKQLVYLWKGATFVDEMAAEEVQTNVSNRLENDGSTVLSSIEREFDETEEFKALFADTKENVQNNPAKETTTKGKRKLKQIRSRDSLRRASVVEKDREISSVYSCIFDYNMKSEVTGTLLIPLPNPMNVTCFDDESGANINNFPFLQQDLYSLRQPALVFIEDSVQRLYLWHGWFEQEKKAVSDDSKFATKKHPSIFNDPMFLKKLKIAKISIENYLKKSGRTIQDVEIVFAGLESRSFQHIFPYWIVNEKVKNLQLGSKVEFSKMNNLEEEMDMILSCTFPLEVLQKRPLPEIVDPTKTEMYLSNEEFQQVFKMSKDDFNNLSLWRRNELRKKNKLF